jgi:hypothetical protein
MKTVEALAKFPEVVVDGYAVQISGKATASTFKAAVSRALGTILKHDSLKRKRFTSVNLEIVVVPEEKA